MNIQKIRLWYLNQDSGYRLFFLFVFKVLAWYIFFELIAMVYLGLIIPGGRYESAFLIKTDLTTVGIDIILWGAYCFLKLLQFDVFIKNNIVGIVGTGGVGIAWPCIGYSAWVVITVLVGCFPGRWSIKLKYIFISSLLIYLLNIIRICILAILAQYDVDLENHHSIYNYVIYAFVSLLFLIYVERFSDYKSSIANK